MEPASRVRAGWALLAGAILFLLAVQLPAHLGYYTYASDARTTYETQGFPLLDALREGTLPWWDPFCAHGRDGSHMTVGEGVFAPDLLAFSWLAQALLPDARTIDQSLLVNLLGRHFLVFGLGIWLLGGVFLRTLPARLYLWAGMVFGMPLFMPLNNQMLAQLWIYLPWWLLFLFRWVERRDAVAVLGGGVVLATLFTALGRDFPLLLYVLALSSLSVAAAFPREALSPRPFKAWGRSSWVATAAMCVALAVLLLSVKALGEGFLGSFTKLRFLANGTVDLPLDAPVPEGGILKGEIGPDLRSLAVPVPPLAVHFGGFHKAHTYLFAGLSALPLAAAAMLSWRDGWVRCWGLLFALCAVSSYAPEISPHPLLRRVLPGLDQYQYLFHLKYVALLCLCALASCGLDRILRAGASAPRRIAVAVHAILAAAGALLAVELKREGVNPGLLWGGMGVLLGVRLLHAIWLWKPREGGEARMLVLPATEAIVGLLFLSIGHVSFEAGWDPVRSDPAYFLAHRPSGLTLRAGSLPGAGPNEPDLSIGAVHKVHFGKGEHLRMSPVARLEGALGLAERREMLGPGTPRLFLSDDVPSELPGAPLRPAGGAEERVRSIEIRPADLRVEPIAGREGWFLLTAPKIRISRHLRTHPAVVSAEKIRLTVDGKEVLPDWGIEDLRKAPEPRYEIHKREGVPLAVVLPMTAASNPDRIVLSFRDPGGIFVFSFGYNHLEVECGAARPSWLVYLDAFAPGWGATVDGKAAEVRAAYGAFKAVPVPAGPHRVRLDYRPVGIRRKWTAVAICYTLLIAMFALSVWRLCRSGAGPAFRS